jgi:hypothetical protein
MKLVRAIAAGAILLATVFLCWGYLGQEASRPAAVAALLGLVWIASLWQTWPSALTSLFLVSDVGLAAGGMVMGVAPGWILGSLIVILVAWDLSHFAQRLQQVEEEDPALVQRHLRRLGLVSAVNLGLVGLSLYVRIQLNLVLSLLLALLVILGLNRTIRRFRTSE